MYVFAKQKLFDKKKESQKKRVCMSLRSKKTLPKKKPQCAKTATLRTIKKKKGKEKNIKPRKMRGNLCQTHYFLAA